jgi:hypothetical protein
MAQIGRTRLPYRSQERHFAKSATFPLWITIPFVLLIGLMLWIGVLADPSGKVGRPGMGSILYTLAVIGVAVFLAYTDRERDPSRKNSRSTSESKERRNAREK